MLCSRPEYGNRHDDDVQPAIQDEYASIKPVQHELSKSMKVRTVVH